MSLAALADHLAAVVVGQERMLRRLLACVVAGGHCLLEGPPGVAKTRTLRALAAGIGGSFARIQFTPDLVPADIVGTRIWLASGERFAVELGPVEANVVLADEVNRAPAKVQSALLEAMEERQVTIGGRRHALPDPFVVVATQNPVESTGVFELPEAQRDRFLMRVVVDLPSTAEEREILRRHDHLGPTVPEIPVTDLAAVRAAQADAARLPVDPAAIEYALAVVAATRADPPGIDRSVATRLSLAASPRATIGLVAAARGLAWLDGRDRVDVQAVYDVAFDVLNHRLRCTLDALADGDTPAAVTVDLLRQVPAPPPPNGPAVGADARDAVRTVAAR